MEDEKISKKKSLKGELTLEMLKEKIHKACYPENDMWYENWIKRTGKKPSSMFCCWHEDEKYFAYKTMLNNELKKYPHLHKQYDIEEAERKLDMEISCLMFKGMTEKQAEKDARVVALKNKIEKIKSTDYEQNKNVAEK